LLFGLVFVSRDFEVGTNISCKESTFSLRKGLIFGMGEAWHFVYA